MFKDLLTLCKILYHSYHSIKHKYIGQFNFFRLVGQLYKSCNGECNFLNYRYILIEIPEEENNEAMV